MKHGMYQPIVKINLCYFHYLNDTIWADYKSLTSGSCPKQKIIFTATLVKTPEMYFSTYSCYWKTKLVHSIKYCITHRGNAT